MKFASLLDLITVFFPPFFCFTKCQDLSHRVQSNESRLKINNLCLDMAEDGNAFKKIDAEGLSSVRPQETSASERPKNEGEDVSKMGDCYAVCFGSTTTVFILICDSVCAG